MSGGIRGAPRGLVGRGWVGENGFLEFRAHGPP